VLKISVFGERRRRRIWRRPVRVQWIEHYDRPPSPTAGARGWAVLKISVFGERRRRRIWRQPSATAGARDRTVEMAVAIEEEDMGSGARCGAGAYADMNNVADVARNRLDPLGRC
jgi:hypothetical protein